MQMISLPQQAERAQRLRDLHPGLILPNAWDAVSARVLEAAGAPAIGTTSAGMAFALGYPDGEVAPVDALMGVLERIVAVTSVPVTADLERGYAEDPAGVARVVERALRVGAAGLNLEDALADGTLRDATEQCARLSAARDAASDFGVRAYLNARTDTYLLGIGASSAERFGETVRRGQAYLAAGADSVFVPGLIDPAEIRSLRAALGGALNVMLLPGGPDAQTLLAAGADRVSAGPGLMLEAMSQTLHATHALLGDLFKPCSLGYADLQRWFTSPDAS